MNNKEKLEILLDFKIGGEKELNEIFSTISSSLDSEKLKTEAAKVQSLVAKTMSSIRKDLESGTTIDIKGSGLLKASKDLSTFLDKTSGIIGSAYGDQALQAFDEKINAANQRVVNAQKNIDRIDSELLQKRNKLQSDLMEGNFGKKLSPDLINADTLISELQKVQAEIEELEAVGKKTTGLREQEKALIAVSEAIKKMNSESAQLRKSRGGHASQKTQGLNVVQEEGMKKQKYLTDFNGEVDEATSSMNKLTAIMEYFRNILTTGEIQKATKDMEKNNAVTKQAETENKKLAKSVKETNKSFSRKLFEGFSYYAIFSKIKQLWSTSVAIVQDLDRAMTEAAIVTNMTQKETWGLLKSYQSLADEVGRSASEIASLNAFFLQQGLNIKNAMEMTEVAAKSAAIAGISLQESANYITSAINGFGLAASAAKDVADKFAAVGAATAADFEELAIAMSKVAPVAQSAGVGIDFMMGVLAKGIHTTREAPENIGTAFKTIFARMSELTDIGKSMEDGMSLNRVEKALNSVNIALRDEVGQFRNLEDVLYEVGFAWQHLDSLQKNYLATALAGTRQQPRLMAILNDFEETVDFIEISKDSAKAMEYQHMEYMQGMEAASQGVRNAWESLVTSVLNSDIIIGILKSVTVALKGAASVLKILNNGFVKMVVIFAALTAGLIFLNKTFSITMKLQAAWISLKKAFVIAQTLVSMGWLGIKAAIDTATAAMAKFWASTGPFIIIAVAIMAVVGGIMALVKWTNKQNALVRENNKLIYESQQRQKDLQSKVDEYEKLTKQIHKTNEELERMKELESELSEFDGIDGKTKNFMKRSSDGSMTLDYDALSKNMAKEEARQKTLDLQIKKQLNKRQKSNQNNAVYYKSNGYSNERVEQMLEDGIQKDFERFGENLQAEGYKAGSSYIDSLVQNSELTNTQAADINKKISKVMDGATAHMFTDQSGQLTFEQAQEFGNKIANIIASNEMKPLINEGQEENSINKLTNKMENYKSMLEEIDNLGLGVNETADIKLSLRSVYEDENTLKLLTENGINIDIIGNFIDEGGKLAELQGIAESLGLGTNKNHAAEEARREQINSEMDKLAEREAEAEWYLNRALNSIWHSDKKGEKDYAERMAAITSEREAYERELEAMSTAEQRALDQGLTQDEKTELLLGKNMESNLKKARQALERSGLTATEANDHLQKELLNFSQTKNSEAIANFGKTISSTFSNALKLDEDLAKGDFSSYMNLVEELGDNGTEIVDRFLESNNPAEIIEQMSENFLKDIADRRDIIKGMMHEGAKEGTDEYKQNEQYKRELAKLDVMESSYQSINQLTAIYDKNLKDINKSLSEADTLYKSIDSMAEAGFAADSPLIGFLQGVADSLQEEAKALSESNLEQIMQNIEDERSRLMSRGLMNSDGQFYNTPEAKRYKANFEELLAQGAEAVQQASNIVLAEIEENNKEFSKRIKESNEEYKKLMDSIKSMHSERWNEINYENQLIDLQRNITKARNELAQSQMLGNKKQIQEASESLRRLQQERRKAVEDEMMSRLEKRIEEDRKEAEDALEKEKLKQNQELIETMEKNTSSIDGLNDTMTKIKKEPIAMASPTEGSKKPSKPKTGDLNQEYAIAGYLPGGSFR